MKSALYTPIAAIALAYAGLAPAETLSLAPTEVRDAAKAGTTLLAYQTSGTQANATALAVYETSPDNDGVRHRQLTIFGKKNGKFVPEAFSNKLIACSKCTQFHDDAFVSENIKVSASHVHIDQFDSGEMPSTTSLDLEKRKEKWYVAKATRVVYEAGRGDPVKANLPIPASGLVQDMDGHWGVPTYFSALVVNDADGRFSFEHGEPTIQHLHRSIAESCMGADCRVLVQQQDGCMSLVRDNTGKSFGVGVSDPQAKAEAVSKALDACNASSSKGCKEIRTDCSKGIL